VGVVTQAIAVGDNVYYYGPFNGVTFCTPNTLTYWTSGDAEYCWHDVWQTADVSRQAADLDTFAYAVSGQVRHRTRYRTISGWHSAGSHVINPGYISIFKLAGSGGWQKRAIVDQASDVGDAYHVSMMFD
jgi:hypothetical protein